MSEMLGNQFFLARNYAAAAVELEDALLKDTGNKGIRRKLIICLNEFGMIQKALTCFLSLIKEDADFIINIDPVAEDCPCPELIYKTEPLLPNNQESVDFLLRLGMLWLYCDVHESAAYFEKARALAPLNINIQAVLSILKTHTRFAESSISSHPHTSR